MARIAVCITILCVAGLALALPRKSHTVQRRGVIQYGAMILCGTGRNPLDYNGYGCYCGLKGHGTPLDDVDRCCQEHDQCYNHLKVSGTCPNELSLYTYSYVTLKCTTCANELYYQLLGITFGSCRKGLCECDALSVKCYNNATYNSNYANYDKSKC